MTPEQKRLRRNALQRARYKTKANLILSKVCLYCGSDFKTTYKKAIYCDRWCGMNYRNRRSSERRREQRLRDGVKPRPPRVDERPKNDIFNEIWLSKPLSKNPNPLVVTYRS